MAMAYVSIPKDLTRVKNKLAFNLTKRQIICIVFAGALGLPFYFLTRENLGTANAATGMVLLMLPEFLFAMYEKDGQPLEAVLKNIISVRFKRPAIRRYETENIYETKVTATEPKRKQKGGKKRGRKKG